MRGNVPRRDTLSLDVDAYIVDAVRTPTGRRDGGLAAVHPVDLAAFVIERLLERTGVDPAAVDDVILGCVDQVGAQALSLIHI